MIAVGTYVKFKPYQSEKTYIGKIVRYEPWAICDLEVEVTESSGKQLIGVYGPNAIEVTEAEALLWMLEN